MLNKHPRSVRKPTPSDTSDVAPASGQSTQSAPDNTESPLSLEFENGDIMSELEEMIWNNIDE